MLRKQLNIIEGSRGFTNHVIKLLETAGFESIKSWQEKLHNKSVADVEKQFATKEFVMDTDFPLSARGWTREEVNQNVKQFLQLYEDYTKEHSATYLTYILAEKPN